MIRLFRWCSLLCLALGFEASAAGLPGAEATLVSIERQSTGTYYVAGELTGYGPLQMLVDTGSSFLVIDSEMLKVLKANGAARYDHDLDGVMANGARMSIPLYRLSSIRIGRDCWVHDVDAAVFPQATRAILGMNVLSRLAPFTFTADPPALSVRSCGSAVQPELVADRSGPAPAARATPAAAP